MVFLSGQFDTRTWNAQAFEALLAELHAQRPGELLRSARLIATYRELQATSRIISKPDPEHVSPAIDRLAQQSLAATLRFMIGCRDLVLAFLGIDEAGVHLLHIGDVASVRSLIAANHPSQLALPGPVRPQLLQQPHWRTEDRLERTFAAVEHLLDRLIDRRDLVFVAAWRVGTDCPAHLDHSLEISRLRAQDAIAEFERHLPPVAFVPGS